MPSAMTPRLVVFGKVVEHEDSDIVERPQCWTILDRNWARETIGPSFAGHATKISHRQAGGARWSVAISGRPTDAPGTARQA
jgi:hypothetical protein